MKEMLRDIFSMSASERKGVMVLITSIVVVTCINIFLVVHVPGKESTDHSQFMAEIKSFEQNREQAADSTARFSTQVLPDPFKQNELFFFDPNSASAEDLKKLGMNSRVIKALLNYRSKGGVFHKAGDLKKLYSLDTLLFAQIKAFVRIEPIDINQADSALFEKLPGIGPVLASRMIKYRIILGGYNKLQQLREVYGITDSIYFMIEPNLTVNPSSLKKINLNKADEGTLSMHPYIGRFAARSILQYRAQMDSIKNFNELYYNGLIPQDKLDKLKDYLEF